MVDKRLFIANDANEIAGGDAIMRSIFTGGRKYLTVLICTIDFILAVFCWTLENLFFNYVKHIAMHMPVYCREKIFKTNEKN